MWVLIRGRAIGSPHELIARVTRNRRSKRVDHDQVEPPLLLDRLNPFPEALEPVLLLPEEVRGRPRIKDDERSFRDLEVEAEGTHLLEEARPAFLEAQVQAVQASPRRVLQEDREPEGGFHRPRRAFDEDDMTPGDSTLQGLVQAFHESAYARGALARSFRDHRGAGSLRGQRRLDGERLRHLIQDVSFPLLLRGRARRLRGRWRGFRGWPGCCDGGFALGDFRSDFLRLLLREPMVRPELEDFRETSSRFREILEELED